MQPGNLNHPHPEPENIGKAFRIDDAIGRYTVYLKGCIDKTCKLEGLKLVLDTAHGAAYKVAPLVFGELGATLVHFGDKPDGKNINCGVGSLHPELMCKMVKEHSADAGLAFDGDADRLILCDENGELVDGDFVIAMLAKQLKARGELKKNTVVGTVVTNLGLETALKEMGINLERTAVGDRYVLQRMLEGGFNLGGEQSGHIIALDHNTTGDGILSALLVLQVVVQTGKPLSELKKVMTRFPQVTINIVVSSKPPLDDIPRFQKELKDVERELEGLGRVIVRYSGTEKKVRVMVECRDEGQCNQYAQRLAEILKTEIG